MRDQINELNKEYACEICDEHSSLIFDKIIDSNNVERIACKKCKTSFLTNGIAIDWKRKFTDDHVYINSDPVVIVCNLPNRQITGPESGTENHNPLESGSGESPLLGGEDRGH